MKKFLFLILSVFLFFNVIGCKTNPINSVSKFGEFGEYYYGIDSTVFDSSRIVVLGSVSVEGKGNEGARYVEIYNAAKKIYPDVDEVINIHVDYSKTIAIHTDDLDYDYKIATSSTVTMTGLAIKYHK